MATWDAGNARQWNHANHMQLDKVLHGLSRLESTIDELCKQIEALPDMLKLTLQTSPLGGLPTPWPRRTVSRIETQDDVVECSSIHEEPDPPNMLMMATTMLPTIAPTIRQTRSYAVHQVFEECFTEMEHDSYCQIVEMGGSFGSSTAVSKLDISAGWTPTWKARLFIIHPASRVCVCLDALRMLFLVIDAFMVPYSLAYDDSLAGWLLYLALLVFSFWSLELVLNFITGYIEIAGGVVMRFSSIVCTYLRGNFLFDFLAVSADGINLAAGLYPEEFSGGFAWQAVRLLRLLKLSRLIRTVAKLNAGLTARVRSNFANWIQLKGWLDYEHHLRFVLILFRLTFVIAWFGHLGSCIWHYCGERVPGDSSWYVDTPGDQDYRKGLYWAITTMFSGASPLRPESSFEVIMSVVWIAIGAMFVTTFTSTLAATLIDASDRKKAITQKNRLLSAYMMQRKTPAVLAVAVHTDFLEKARSVPILTELDLPFLESLDPQIKANLRDCCHGRCFVRHDFFRMLKVLDESIVKALCARALCAVHQGDDVFHAQQKMQRAVLLTKGTTWYTLAPTGTARSGGRFTRRGSLSTNAATTPLRFIRSLDTCSTSETPKAMAVLGGSQNSSRAHLRKRDAIEVRGEAWMCELALLLSWTTVGSLEAEGTCEFLLISAEVFVRLVTANPALSAVVSSYAVQASMTLLEESHLATDIDSGVDYDSIVCRLHPAVRGMLLSMPVFATLRQFWRQPRMHIRKRKMLMELRDEVRLGKCHLSIADDNECCRVVHLVALELQRQDGRICVLLAQTTPEGNCVPKFKLPGRKVEDTERPEEAMAKLLRTELGSLAGAMQIQDGVRREVEQNNSPTYSLRTKYIKTVFAAVLAGTLILGGEGWGSEKRDPTNPMPIRASSNSHQTVQTVLGRISSRTGSMQFMKQQRQTPSRGGRRGGSNHSGGAHRRSMELLASSPFPLEGPDHAFAVVKSEDGEPPQEGFLPEDVSCNIYKWMDPQDFENLLPRRSDVEKEVRHHSISPKYLRRLLDWDVRMDVEGFAETF